MEYFQTAWRDGSSLNKGLTSEEFFYNQIYNALEVNVANRTLPFFNTDAKTVPVELSTGKIINDENLIALEQISSKKGYSSNVWIYGDVLNKMQKEGIPLNLRLDAEPVLCLTKYANYTHLNKPELYIAEGGSKAKAQYLYTMIPWMNVQKRQLINTLRTQLRLIRFIQKKTSRTISITSKSPRLKFSLALKQ